MIYKCCMVRQGWGRITKHFRPKDTCNAGNKITSSLILSLKMFYLTTQLIIACFPFFFFFRSNIHLGYTSRQPVNKTISLWCHINLGRIPLTENFPYFELYLSSKFFVLVAMPIIFRTYKIFTLPIFKYCYSDPLNLGFLSFIWR